MNVATLPVEKNHELSSLFDSGDLYGAMLFAVRAWHQKHHAASSHCVIVVDEGEGRPPTQVTVVSSSAS